MKVRSSTRKSQLIWSQAAELEAGEKAVQLEQAQQAADALESKMSDVQACLVVVVWVTTDG